MSVVRFIDDKIGLLGALYYFGFCTYFLMELPLFSISSRRVSRSIAKIGCMEFDEERYNFSFEDLNGLIFCTASEKLVFV